jgi:hypothetical protein
MKNRILYIASMSITLLLAYVVYHFMFGYMTSGVYYLFSATDKAIMCAFIAFAPCEFLIQIFGLHLDFPFVTKRISRIMFDILIFLRFISVFPLLDYSNNYEIIILYNFLSLIPLIIIFITEKKQAGKPPIQGIAPFLIITALCLVSDFIISMSNMFYMSISHLYFDDLFVITVPTILGIFINLIIADWFINKYQNYASPLLTSVSLFIATTPPMLMFSFIVLFPSLFE